MLEQITRVYKGKEHAEVEFTVSSSLLFLFLCELNWSCVSQWHTGFQIGPIPIDDGQGKEVVADITTAMKSNKTFYTDSSGRDFIERVCCMLV